MNGKKYKEVGDKHKKVYLNGDVNGNAVAGTTFYIDCKGQWNNTERIFPGPCHFRPTDAGTEGKILGLAK